MLNLKVIAIRCTWIVLLGYPGITSWRKFAFVDAQADDICLPSGLVSSVPAVDVVLVKIGGSSITNKAIKETLNQEALSWFIQSLAQSISPFYLSNHNDKDDNNIPPIDAENESKNRSNAYIIVHGAGSFGHHSAKEYGLGGKTINASNSSANVCTTTAKRKYTMRGVSLTRNSVQRLNSAVVTALTNVGIHAIGISPCFSFPGIDANGCGVDNNKFCENTITSALLSIVQSGLVPVLHGDVCLYGGETNSIAGILSGDTLMEIIGKASWISRVVFITDVDGVYTMDPRLNPSAQLIPSIAVDSKSGEIIDASTFDASGSSHSHDVTGGLKTKLASAASIAATRKNVTIVRCMSTSALKAIQTTKDTSIENSTVLYAV